MSLEVSIKVLYKHPNRKAEVLYEQFLIVPHAAVNVCVVRRDVDDDEGPEILVSRLPQRFPRPIQINGGLNLFCQTWNYLVIMSLLYFEDIVLSDGAALPG